MLVLPFILDNNYIELSIINIRLYWVQNMYVIYTVSQILWQKRTKPLCIDCNMCITCFSTILKRCMCVWSICSTKSTSWNDDGKLSFMWLRRATHKRVHACTCLQIYMLVTCILKCELIWFIQLTCRSILA